MYPKPLDETDMYVLFHEHEDIFLFAKDANLEVCRTSMYGNPTCGIIGHSNEWAIIGGECLILWKNNELKIIDEADLTWIHNIRTVGPNEVEILTDPWSVHSAVWRFDIFTEEKIKIKDFPDYRDKEYTDNINW